MPSLTSKKYRFAFIMITSLFFFWGFVHNINSALIPHLKRSFTLNITQSTLVDSAIYIAYFLMALPAGFIMKKFGYKAGIIAGLLFFATGIFLFVPAANMQSYNFFLLALFIIACGLTMLETAANPYASALGDTETSTQRLNFSQSFNGLAAVLAPVIGAKVILTHTFKDEELRNMTEAARKIALASEASSVKTPYFLFGILLVLVLIIFIFTKLPVIREDETQAGSKNIFHAFKHRHLSWAVVAQFFYVGAQVCVISLFVLYATKSSGLGEKEVANYAGAGGLAFMVGRFIGTFLMNYIKPNRLLAIYAAINILLCIIAIEAHGMITIYAVVGIYFFMSIMFPTIFALGIKELKGDTEFGSSLLIMAIVGGAILPRIFGYISDGTGNIQNGYIVPLVCFAVILFFAWKGYKVVNKSAV
jgi:MFS transporter, FHS family, L-fucose permease